MLCCGNRQTKERITAALWPDLPPAKATSNFHINLYRARRAVFPGIFTLENGQYGLNSDINIWFDVEEYENLFSQVEELPPNSETRVANLERVAELYRGSFMEDFYTEWTETQRRYLEDKYLKTLSLLANSYADKGKYDKAIDLLKKYIAIDPYQEEVYCQIIEWHLVVGDRISALQTYKRCLDIVGSEAEFIPYSRIEELHKNILTPEDMGQTST
jgi:DNA-binding SARP family transcriptional activator